MIDHESTNPYKDFSSGVVNITKAQWIEFITSGVLTEKDIIYLSKYYALPNHASSPKRLSELEGTDPSSYISPCTSIGRRISNLLSLSPIPRDGEEDTQMYYPVIFLGRRLNSGHFEWKLRPELAEAMEVCCTDLLADGIKFVERMEEEEAERLPVDELLRRAKQYHGGVSEVYTSRTKQRKRNGMLVAAAKARAGGICQLCGGIPFLGRNGKPYLEAHHIVPLSDDGPDELNNMVALCPNCHRKMHELKREEDIETLKEVARE